MTKPEETEEDVCKKRKLCELGTGEIVHVLSYKCLPEKIEEFERIVQVIAHDLYETRTSV